jgi:zona occludens toxin (predicted ATPase)
MQRAKEKAKELVDVFYQTILNKALGIPNRFKVAEYKAWKQAKQCALINLGVS